MEIGVLKKVSEGNGVVVAFEMSGADSNSEMSDMCE